MANGDARRRRARVDVGDATRDESRDAIAVASDGDARRRDATRRATNALASLRDYDDGGDDDDDDDRARRRGRTRRYRSGGNARSTPRAGEGTTTTSL
jgi:hypothetical protein